MKKEVRKGNSLSIKRTATPAETLNEQTPQVAPSTPSASATGGITLASGSTETDPFRKSLTEAGYIILEENEYGIVARQDKGKPTFIPRTKHGFDPNENTVRNSLVLPEHMDIAMKVHAARNRMSVTQYITQLIVADLRKNSDL